LKANIPGNLRVRNRHQGSGEGHRVEGLLAAAHLSGKERKSPHDCGAHHGRVSPDQHSIKTKTNDGSYSSLAGTHQAAKQTGEQPRDNRHIETVKTKPK
jgi:hypothetical protein